jgi:hypothetical protein
MLTTSLRTGGVMSSSDPVQRFLDAVIDPTLGFAEVFSSDAVLDATVPNWRYTVTGAELVTRELGRWYAHTGAFDSVTRVSLPDGELVQFDLSWEEDGTPHAVHQAHVLAIVADRVTRDTAWCGGRWSAALLAEMEAAALSAV